MPFGRPFRAISLCVSFPGLKPWAVFCSPVGRLELAQENVQTPGGKPRAQPRAELTSPCGPYQARYRRTHPAPPSGFPCLRAKSGEGGPWMTCFISM